MNLGNVLEGRCPTCDTMLERRDDCGWCPKCNIGHSATMHNGEGEHRVHIEIAGAEGMTSLGPIRMGPGRVVIVAKVSDDTPPTAD